MSKKRGYLYAILVSVLWGLSFIGSKEAMAGGFDTFSLVAVRFILASVVLLISAGVQKISLKVEKRDILPLFITSVTGITLYYFFELKGLQNTSASVASLIISTIPVFSLLTAVVLYKKRPPLLTWSGVALSLLGVYMVVFNGAGTNSIMGCLVLFGGCICWVSYLEMTDRLLKKYSNTCVTFWQSALSLLTAIPMALTENVRWTAIPLNAWLWALIFLGLVCSYLCFMMNNQSVAILTPQVNSVFLNLSPVATAVGGWLVLGETITPVQLLGGAVILTALFIISFSDRKK